jgi:hypothetical protein
MKEFTFYTRLDGVTVRVLSGALNREARLIVAKDNGENYVYDEKIGCGLNDEDVVNVVGAQLKFNGLEDYAGRIQSVVALVLPLARAAERERRTPKHFCEYCEQKTNEDICPNCHVPFTDEAAKRMYGEPVKGAVR